MKPEIKILKSSMKITTENAIVRTKDHEDIFNLFLIQHLPKEATDLLQLLQLPTALDSDSDKEVDNTDEDDDCATDSDDYVSENESAEDV